MNFFQQVAFPFIVKPITFLYFILKIAFYEVLVFNFYQLRKNIYE